jgi:hypothetical protein
MKLIADKKWIKSEIDKIEDEESLAVIKNLLNYINQKVSNMKPMTMGEYYSMIEESERDIKEGKIHVHEDVVKYFKNKK